MVGRFGHVEGWIMYCTPLIATDRSYLFLDGWMLRKGCRSRKLLWLLRLRGVGRSDMIGWMDESVCITSGIGIRYFTPTCLVATTLQDAELKLPMTGPSRNIAVVFDRQLVASSPRLLIPPPP